MPNILARNSVSHFKGRVKFRQKSSHIKHEYKIDWWQIRNLLWGRGGVGGGGRGHRRDKWFMGKISKVKKQ